MSRAASMVEPAKASVWRRPPPAHRRSVAWPLVALVLTVAILYVAKAVIVPLALAILLTFILAPVVTAIQRSGLGRVPAVLFTAFLTFILLGLVGCIVGIEVHSLASELPTHRKEIEAKLASLQGDGEGAFAKLFQMFREIGQGKTEAASKSDQTAPPEKVVLAQPEASSSLEQLTSGASPFLEPLAQAGLIVVLVIFMLIMREDLRNRIIGLLGHGRLTGTTRVLVDSAERVSSFLLTQLLINIGFGVLFAVGLFFAGVPYAFLWGFFAVVLRFVPYVGSLVAVAFPLALSFVAPGWTQPIIVVSLFVVLELITSNVVEPLFIGHGTGITPIALLVAAAFWTWVWGPVGLVLSTPLTVCLVVLGQNAPRLRFLALLLGDRPALEPYVSYYQRLLSRDQQEAKQIAMDHTRASGPESVYDEVLLPALALARRDRKNAGLSAEDEAFVFQATKDIVESLADQAAKQSTPIRDADANTSAETGHSVLCGIVVLGCPAHHAAEELSVSMLGQLLQANGGQVEALSTQELPSEVEADVERYNPALVFIAILPPGGLVQACYLCKRLRKRFKALPLVIGYWGDDRHYDQVLARLRSAGASYVTTSLLQSRSQIRALVAPVMAADRQSCARSLVPTPTAVGDPPNTNHARGGTPS